MTELEEQIKETEEQVKQATNLNKMIPLILKNQLAIMKRLNPEASLKVWPPTEPIEIQIPLRPETRTIEEGK